MILGVTDYTLFRTQTGALRLQHQGYIYQCNMVRKNTPLKYWQCSLYKKCENRCKARAVLETPNLLNVKVPHNHPPSVMENDGQ